MAKDILSKYGKASSKKVRPRGNTAGTWATNVLKSFGYSTIDALQEVIPATIDVASASVQAGKSLVDTVKTAKRGDKQLSIAMKKNFYYGLASEFWKNSLEDIKSGKFYNKDRLDQFYHESNDTGDMDFGGMDFGTEDFDAGEDSFSTASFESEDGDTRGSVTTKSKKGIDITNVNVVSDLGPDSTMANLSKIQTNAIVDVGSATISNSQSSTRAILSNLSVLRTEVTASLSVIDSNVANISTSFADTMGPHTSLAAKFYDDSIKLQTSILEAIQNGASKGPQVEAADANTKQFREYQNVMDMFSSGGALDIGAYKNLVKKQANRYVEGNLILSQFKNVLDQKEGLMMYAKNPLSMFTNAIVKGLIPGILKESLQQFDLQLKETGVAALNQLSGLRRSDKPIQRAIGEIFGIQNKVNKSLDKSAYNKGAVAWSGTDHQALTNVIPTLLRKMLANQTGTQEIDFDYEKGVFRTVKEMERDVIASRNRMKTSEYGETMSDFRNYLDKSFGMDDKEKDLASKAMEKFITKMTMDPYGGMHYRKGGRTGNDDNGRRDDIASAIGGTSDSLNVQLIRSYFTAMEQNRKAELTSLFGSKLQDQRAAYNQLTETMQRDPLRYNAKFIENGLSGANRTDAHLKYDKDTGKLSTDRSNSSMGSGVDQFGRSSVSYLRDIVSILGTGVPVLPIISTTSRRRRRGRGSDTQESELGGRAALIMERADAARRRLKTDKNKRIEDDKAVKPRYKSRTAQEVQKDARDGKLEITQADNVNIDQMVAQASAYMTNEDNNSNRNKETFFDKLVGKMPDSAFKSFLVKAQEKITSGQSNFGKIIDKADNALFNLVFGNPNKDSRNLFDRIKAGFTDKIFNPLKYKLFGDEGILSKLDEKLFGTDGIFSKIKQSDIMKRFTDRFKIIGNSVSTFILGNKNADTGNREGGILSNTANAFIQIGRDAKDALLGKKGPDGKPLPLDQDDSVLGNIKRIFHAGTDKLDKLFGGEGGASEQIGLDKRIVNTFDAMADRFKARSSELMDNMFGPVGEDGKRSFQRQFVDDLRNDLKGQSGFLGASAVLGAVGVPLLGSHLGLLGSMFLPGGPVGGAIIGTAIGIATKSSTFQNFLFGEEVDGERTGGLITKEFQDTFNEHKVGLAVGGIAGLASSYGLLPAFLFPGGPIGGVLGGLAISMATKSGAFENLMFGPGGSKEEPTGGLAKKFKDIFGRDKDLKTVGLDAGIGAGLGVLGSLFLPGGPIIGALVGAGLSIGTSTEKFKNWFFGEEDPETKKREGGIYGKFTGFMKDKVFDKLTTATKTVQYKLLSFVETNMAIPFKYALQPLLTEAQHAKDAIAGSIKKVFTKFSDALHKHVTAPIGKFLNTFLFNPFKKLLHGLFGGLGKLVGGIISAPFKMLGLMGDVAYGAQKGRGKKSYKKQVIDNSEFGEEATKRREREGIKFGLFSQKKYNEETGKWEKVGRGKIAAKIDVARQRFDRQKLKDARFNDDGAFYERDQEIERNKRRKLETRAINAYYEACARASANKDPIPNRADFLAAFGIEETRRKKDKKGKKSKEATSTPIVDGTEIDAGGHSNVTRSTENSSPVADGTSESIDGSGYDDSGSTKGKKFKSKKEGKKSKKSGSNKVGRGSRSRAKKNAKKNRSKVADEYYEPPTSKPPKVDNSSQKTAKVKTKIVNTKYDWMKSLSNIDRNVSKICDSVYGQMNGVGSNVNKIYRTLLKRFGMEDDKIAGDNNKSYVGFIGRIRTALNNPIRAAKDLITFPFRKINEGIANVKQHVLDTIGNIGAIAVTLAEAGQDLIKGIASVPMLLVNGVVNFFKKHKTKLKGLVDAAADGMEYAITHVREFGKKAIPAIIKGITESAKFVGKGIAGSAGLIYSAFKWGAEKTKATFNGIGEFVNNVKDKIFSDSVQDKVKRVKKFGSDVKDRTKDKLQGAKTFFKDKFGKVGDIVSGITDRIGKVLAPVGKVAGALNPFKWFKKKAMHVIVDGGTLDTVKKVKKVKLNEKVWVAGILKKQKTDSGKPDGSPEEDSGTPPGSYTGIKDFFFKNLWRLLGIRPVHPNVDQDAVDLEPSPVADTAPTQENTSDTTTSDSTQESQSQGQKSEKQSTDPQPKREGFFDRLFNKHKKEPGANGVASGFMDGLQSPMGMFDDPNMSANFMNAGKIGLNFALGGFNPLSMLRSAGPAAQMLGISGTALHGIQGTSALARTLLPFITFGMNPLSAVQAIFPAMQLLSSGKNLFKDFKQKDEERKASGKESIASTVRNTFRSIGTSVSSTIGDGLKSVYNFGKTGVSKLFGNDEGSADGKIKSTSGRLAQVAKGSREALLERFNKYSKEEEEARYKESMLAATTATAEATSEHKVGWRSIFGKKGLITGALLLALPMLLKIGPKILGFLSNLNIGSLISDVISNVSQNVNEAGGIGGVANRALNLGKRVANGISGEASVNKIDDNGNLVFNEDGSLAQDKVDTNIIKEVFMPTRTRVNLNNGEWSNDRVVTRSSEELLNYAVVSNKKLIGGAIDVTKKVTSGAKKLITSNPVKAVVSKIGNTTVGKTALAAKDVAVQGSQKLLDLFMKKGKGALLSLVDKLIGVAKKLGFNVTTSNFDTIIKPFIAKVFNSSVVQRFGKKISKFFATLTGKVAGAAGTAGLLELGFVAYGAIEGATNAAAVFEVRAEDVDLKMRAIATCLKGFTNSSLGAVLDLIDAIGQELSLGSIIKSLANWLYGFISSEEEKTELKNAQDAFTDDYHDYVSKEYEEYRKQAESNGQAAMTMDEFKQSNLVTTRGEYNSKTNKSLTRKVVDTVKGAGNFVKHPIKSIKSAAKTVGRKISDAANTVGSFASTKFNQAKNFVGTKLSEGVSAVTSIKDNFVKGHRVVADKIQSGLDSGLKNVSKISKDISSYWTNATSGISNAVSDLDSKISSTISSFRDEMKKHGIFGGIASFLKKDSTKAYYDTYGNYYVLQSDGTYTYYNTHGDVLATKIDAEVVQDKLATGLLTEGTIEKNSKAKDALLSIKASAVNLWDTAKSTISKVFGDVSTTAGNIVTGAKNVIGNAVGSITNFFGGKGGSKIASGKGSGETFNGMPYYSQNDPKYRSKRYLNTENTADTGTIAERGCGPAVMASVATKATGKQFDPVTMANAAVAGGFSKDVGTTPDYFMSTAKSLGIPSMQTAPTSANIKASLDLGNSIIMQGRGRSSTSPYTEEGHYVNVVGLEGDNVIVNDPRGKQTSGKYKLEDVLNNTTGMWTFGNTKNVKKDTSKNILGGRGSENMTEMEKALVGTMLSIEKKDTYSQDQDKRGLVGRGYGDCSSTTQWVYKTALGVDPGGYTGAQIQSPIFKDVDSGGNIPNESNLRPGDLLFYRAQNGGGHSPTGVSHVEMYIGDGQIMGHGKGQGPFKDSINSRAGRYMKARRYTGDATVQQGAVSDVSGVGAGLDGSITSSTTSSGNSSGFSSITELLGGLASAIANPILEKLGLKTADTSTDSTSRVSSSMTGSVSAMDVQGNSDKEKIFNFLTANGFTENAAAGAMGCWEEESHNSANTLEGGYKLSNPATEIPKIVSSNESLDTYSTGRLFPLYANSGLSIDKSAYMSGGHYYPGFGLAQWTGPRGENLLNFARSKGANWGDLTTQLDFFLNGPGEFKDRSAKNGLLQKLNATGSPEDGATEFLDGFEMSPGWHTSKQGQIQNAKRRTHARTIYNTFAGKNASADNSQTLAGAGGMGGTGNSNPLDSTSIEDKNLAILQDRADFARKLVQEQLQAKEADIKEQKKLEKAKKNAESSKGSDKKISKLGKVARVEQAKPTKDVGALSTTASNLVNGSLVEPIAPLKKITVNARKNSLSGKTMPKTMVERASGSTTEYKPSLDNIADILVKALDALRDIVANTGSTTDGISKLNEKDFTSVNIQGSGGTSVKQSTPSATKNNIDRVPGSAADRSEYKLAKQIAKGIFV